MGERSEESAGRGDRPLPGEGTAEGEALRRAHRAFEVGDFRSLRVLADALAGAPDAELAAAGRELRARVAFDPVAAVVLLGGLAFFVAIAWIYLR